MSCLIVHFSNQHPNTLFPRDTLISLGLTVCDNCGVAVRNEKGVAFHARRCGKAKRLVPESPLHPSPRRCDLAKKAIPSPYHNRLASSSSNARIDPPSSDRPATPDSPSPPSPSSLLLAEVAAQVAARPSAPAPPHSDTSPSDPPPPSSSPLPPQLSQPRASPVISQAGQLPFPELLDIPKALAHLPVTRKPLGNRLRNGFKERVHRIAIAYNESGGDMAARDFFLIPKVALTPGLRFGVDHALERLAAFPNCNWPSPSESTPHSSRVTRCTRLVSQGRLGAATRVLLSDDEDPAGSAVSPDDKTSRTDSKSSSRIPCQQYQLIYLSKILHGISEAMKRPSG